MIEIVARVDANCGAPPAGYIELSFAARQKRQFTAKLRCGEGVLVRLPRGPILRGGDLLRSRDGKVIEVIAAPESLLHIEAGSAQGLARLAYHLGNRHVAVEVGAGFLRIAEDAVLGKMLLGLGAAVRRIVAAFEPEAGAYAHDHPRREDAGQPGRIHEYVEKPGGESR